MTLAVALQGFTLGWTHSVEKTRWEEDWRVTALGLVIEEARIEGSGAGMEIPADAILAEGFWVYRPELAPQKEVRLLDAGRGADWDICVAGDCRPIASLVPNRGIETVLAPCPQGTVLTTWLELADRVSDETAD